MTACPNCSTENADDASFCEACGTSLDAPSSSSAFPSGRSDADGAKRTAVAVSSIATAIRVLLLISAVIMLIRIPTRLNALSKLTDFIDRPSSGRFDDAVDAFAIDGSLAFVHFGVMLALFVLFIIFGHRLVTNALAWRKRPIVSPGMAIGGWFIPVYCLKAPYDTIAGSHKAVADDPNSPMPEDTTGNRLILAWWLLFAAAQVIGDWFARLVGNSGQRVSLEAGSAFDCVRTSIQMQLLGQILLIASAVVGFFAVKTIAIRQQERMLAPDTDV